MEKIKFIFIEPKIEFIEINNSEEILLGSWTNYHKHRPNNDISMDME